MAESKLTRPAVQVEQIEQESLSEYDALSFLGYQSTLNFYKLMFALGPCSDDCGAFSTYGLDPVKTGISRLVRFGAIVGLMKARNGVLWAANKVIKNSVRNATILAVVGGGALAVGVMTAGDYIESLRMLPAEKKAAILAFLEGKVKEKSAFVNPRSLAKAERILAVEDTISLDLNSSLNVSDLNALN